MSDASTPPDSLLALQRRFAGHIRDPESTPPPDGVEDRRMAIYRRLFFGNLRNLMAKNFPVLRRLVDDEGWDRLIRRFMAEHRATTPMFTEIGREFVRYFSDTQPDDLPPFAPELVHWEYLETVVRLHAAEVTVEGIEVGGDLLAQPPALNPTLQAARYHWPVHEISPDFQPEVPLEQPIVLAACRRADHSISFMRLNPVTARLVALMQEFPADSGREVLVRIADELNTNNVEQIITSGTRMLERLRESAFVLGTRLAAQ